MKFLFYEKNRNNSKSRIPSGCFNEYKTPNDFQNNLVSLYEDMHESINSNKFVACLVVSEIQGHLEEQGMHILLPIANCIEKKKFSLGEFILKEGEVPNGMYMIVKGQCIVGSKKLNIRSKQQIGYERYKEVKKPITIKGDFKDAIREE